MQPVARLLGQGDRLHLHHGPIDLIIAADGDRRRAFDAARGRFETILSELMVEIDLLRRPLSEERMRPEGETARRMMDAAWAFRDAGFVTAMAGVAGAVAESVLDAMVAHADLQRAYVNNGGDIALHLTPEQRFRTAMLGQEGQSLGVIEITYNDCVRGIATSGQHGRSFSFGIADSVTVLASHAAEADVAATLIANAVDLPNHSAISRAPACELDDMSDLGRRLVVTGCAGLTDFEVATALSRGVGRAREFCQNDHIHGACLHFAGQSRVVGRMPVTLSQGTIEYA
ncbi:UPF0280 family protein [Sulfitobacter sp. F26204]|uniref:UPF0280 family protein n=1 Tax=Sulfitobacter sp. F26204 TaxID=2996014 RepID=UPI00225E3D58|nr:UPF0280 family protein [Sulfitobacter sp. F26204]MCX7559722.1 UPF0280 family protein [Sulfitobacter sp. F26204]